MKLGLYVPNVGPFGDPGVLVELGQRVEASGWDGFFVWDMLTPAYAPPEGPPHAADPWVVLSAIAASTSRIRLGPMITPLARRRPHKLARETASLDRLSGGRLVLGVGLGDKPEMEFGTFGEDMDPRRRAARLDESLEILARLWSGTETTFVGEYFEVRGATFLPRPVQEPGIPVWVAGHWPNRRPLRRAARWDGMFPLGDRPLLPADYREITALAGDSGARERAWDLVHASPAAGTGCDERTVADYETSGVTWWFERFGPGDRVEAALERALRGPLD